MPPIDAPETATGKRRIWPITAMLVVFALLLFLGQGFLAGFATSRLFGVLPSRDTFIASGMICLTTLPIFAAMIWWGWQLGSRHGLWLIGGLAALMAWLAFDMLMTTGSSREPHVGRVPGLADLFGQYTGINWALFVVFLGCAVTTHVLRRARQVETGSAA